MTFSFVNKIISEKGQNIHKVKAIDGTGRKAYYFVLVDPTKEKDFRIAITNGSLNLEDYGTILASCYGEKPNNDMNQQF